MSCAQRVDAPWRRAGATRPSVSSELSVVRSISVMARSSQAAWLSALIERRLVDRAGAALQRRAVDVAHGFQKAEVERHAGIARDAMAGGGVGRHARRQRRDLAATGAIIASASRMLLLIFRPSLDRPLLPGGLDRGRERLPRPSRDRHNDNPCSVAPRVLNCAVHSRNGRGLQPIFDRTVKSSCRLSTCRGRRV